VDTQYYSSLGEARISGCLRALAFECAESVEKCVSIRRAAVLVERPLLTALLGIVKSQLNFDQAGFEASIEYLDQALRRDTAQFYELPIMQ
jgi:hypothetical protein